MQSHFSTGNCSQTKGSCSSLNSAMLIWAVMLVFPTLELATLNVFHDIARCIWRQNLKTPSILHSGEIVNEERRNEPHSELPFQDGIWNVAKLSEIAALYGGNKAMFRDYLHYLKSPQETLFAHIYAATSPPPLMELQSTVVFTYM